MSYTVLARKYRPQRFSDLIGQEHVTRTLCNAITSNRVAHAFLLTGVRGVGKTTTARILAKALNCETGPSIDPCNTCAPCKEITAGTDMDVIEIDGASNNSVEDVRRLQETLPFQPARDRFKVLIVDEVHMLSNSAFNALLKTLEEPPSHVKFILATTEAHKVPITIRSRCQRYDYRLIPSSVIANRIQEILAKEAISADTETISMVAREAAGSMRDALTLLDQIVAFAGEQLDYAKVASMLGIADRRVVFELAHALLEHDPKHVLHVIDTVCEQGMDVAHTLKQLLGVMRDFVILETTGETSELLDMTDDEQAKARTLLASMSGLELQRVYSMLSKLLDDIVHSSSPRMDLEMGLLRIAASPALRDMHCLLEELEGLTQEPSTEPTPTPSRPARSNPVPKPSHTARAPHATPKPARTTSSQPSPSPSSTPALWEAVVSRLRTSRPALAAVLEHGVIESLEPHHIVIAFEKQSFYAHQADSPEALAAVAEIAAHVMNLDAGSLPKVEITRAAPTSRESLVKQKGDQIKARQEKVRQQALAHPAVKDALEIFSEASSKIDVRVDVD